METPILFLLLLCANITTATFKICAFNIKSFGEAKVSNKKVMSSLVKILSRCDISVIQEVRDSKGEAIPALVKELNRFDPLHSYVYLESKRLGKNSYKEQFVFIYRADLVKATDFYHYVEDRPDLPEAFAREPFIVRFHSPKTAVKDFVLVSHHTCPREAAKEINKLLQVMLEAKSRWKIENVMLLGDLNASCGYITLDEWKEIQLRSGSSFHWLIGDKEDTTVSPKTHCAYDRWSLPVCNGDMHVPCCQICRNRSLSQALPEGFREKKSMVFPWRDDVTAMLVILDPAETGGDMTAAAVLPRKTVGIVVYGEDFYKAIVPTSAKPFNFKKKLGLSEEEALEVSDHFPVEVNLRVDPRVNREL